MSDFTGQTLGERYRVDAFLGHGGMADVYQVWDLQRAVPLALKVLHDAQARDKVFLERFRREARTLEMLQHPNIVRCYGLGEAGGQAFLLMDFIDGLTLDQEILKYKTSGMPPQRILELLRPVCAALFFAHRQGLVHCDIKPANIMVHRNGTVYLTDFGIAHLSEASAEGLPTAGTPAYMAPEQIAGAEPAPASDIYALGGVLFEMLTGGKRPFTGQSAKISGSTAKKVFWEKHHLPAPSPRKYNPAVSQAFERIVRRCLAARPEQRYENTLDLLREIEAAIREDAARESSARGAAQDEELSTQADMRVLAQEVLDAPQPPKKPRISRMAAAVTGAGLLLACLGLILFANTAHAPSTPVLTTVAGISTATGNATAEPAALSSANSEAPARPPATPRATEPALEPSPTPQPTLRGGRPWIAFASDRSGELQIWIMQAENPDMRRQLTDIRGGACQPAWSPDGARIAFTTPCKGPGVFHIGATIQIVDVESKTIADLKLPRNSFDPSWSADGKSILFTALAPSEAEVRAVDVSSGAVTRVMRRGTKAAQPACARAGDAVVFVTNDDRRRDALWLMEPDGSSPEVFNESAMFSEPVFSPDGRWVLASVNSGDNRPYLALFSRSDPTAAGQRLLDTDYTQNHGAFSPDGQWIVFWSELIHNAGGEILMVNINSKEVIQLTKNDKRDIQPAWGP